MNHSPGASSSLPDALQRLLQRLPEGSFIGICSDLSDLQPDLAGPLLHQLNQRHKMMIWQILDPVETELPSNGHWLLADAAEGDSLSLSPADARQRDAYAEAMQQQQQQLQELFFQLEIPFRCCTTEDTLETCLGLDQADDH